MARHDETIFSIHGLDIDSRVVRADVFVQKLTILISTLREADKGVNGRRFHDYLLPSLQTGSTEATLRERLLKRKPSQSPISHFERAVVAVYRGDRQIISSLNPKIISGIEKLSRGAKDQFAHAEIRFYDDNVIRIDEYLQHKAEEALNSLRDTTMERSQSYAGMAFGSFEGVLKELDSRGTMLRGKLVMVPSATEIDCVMNKDRVPDARESFDQRVIAKGIAHYDGRSSLPQRVDVHKIRIIDQGGDLLRWKGAFVFPETVDSEDS